MLTDDLGVVTDDFGEIEGRHGTIFRITGRAKNAEVRGCGDIMSSYLEKEKTQSKSDGRTKLEPKFLFIEEYVNPIR